MADKEHQSPDCYPKPSGHESNEVINPSNVILITLDAFNYDLFVDNLDILPNLKALKSESAFMENAFSVGASTFFAFPGIIASVYPYHFGIGIDRNIKAMDAVFKDYGYNTAIINEANALLTPYFGYCMNTDYQKHFLELSHAEGDRKIVDTFIKGADEVNHKRYLGPANLLRKLHGKLSIKWIGNFGAYCFSVGRFLGLYLTNDTESFASRAKLHHQFRNEVLEFIRRRFESPQFLWIHTIINHMPYFPPENSCQLSTREVNYLNYRGLSSFVNHKICARLKSLHLESMKTTDKLIGDILDALRINKMLDNSIVVVTADHGEEFMEEGYFGHSPESSSDRLLRVPLMFYCPNILPPKNISSPVSTLDILPTVCDLLEVGIPSTTRGISLKEQLMRVSGHPKEDEQLWSRPLFSEAWETKGLLDRDPGHDSAKKVFTVRKGQHKLKVVQKTESGNTIYEEYELSNWTSNEKLDVEDSNEIFEDLIFLLRDHIRNEGAFTSSIRRIAEEERIQKALQAVRSEE